MRHSRHPLKSLIDITVYIVMLLAPIAGDQIAAFIPLPAKVESASGVCRLDSLASISAGADDQALAKDLAERITRAGGPALKVLSTDKSPSAGGITLFKTAAKANTSPEGYELVVTPQSIQVRATQAAGLFYGVQTLLQMLPPQVYANPPGKGGEWVIPCLRISDEPRFQWRGMMLDCSRHFFTVPEVLRFIDLMAMHKMNTFHWHLTDDQGWRIEVKKYPKLTSVGAWRSAGGKEYGGFYTQDEIRHIVAYAAERHITVVPELEMPGHSTATIASYPELGNTDVPDWKNPTVSSNRGIKENILAPKEETFQFYANVFDEVLPLFPGPYVHVGADEAPKKEWKKSPFAQKVMKDNQLKNEHELQSWFIRRIEKLLIERKKRLIGWDEIQEGGLSPTATMMVWRDWKYAKQALAKGNNIVMAPKTHTYLDYGQGSNPGGANFHNMGHLLELSKVYSFEPVPEGTPDKAIAQVLGCQGQVWTEFIWSTPKAEYMAWPRACAIAETAWTQKSLKNFDDFQLRMSSHEKRLDAMQVNYRKNDGAPAQPQQSMDLTPHYKGSQGKK